MQFPLHAVNIQPQHLVIETNNSLQFLESFYFVFILYLFTYLFEFVQVLVTYSLTTHKCQVLCFSSVVHHWPLWGLGGDWSLRMLKVLNRTLQEENKLVASAGRKHISSPIPAVKILSLPIHRPRKCLQNGSFYPNKIQKGFRLAA